MALTPAQRQRQRANQMMLLQMQMAMVRGGASKRSRLPIVNVPGDQSVDINNLPFVFNTISVSDDFEPELTMIISVGIGVISLNGTTGLTFEEGDGTSDATMTFYGSIADINAALNGMSIDEQINSIVSLVVTATNTTGSTTKTVVIDVGDLTAPVLSSVTASNVGSTQVNTQANTTDATGTGFVVLTNSSQTPSAGNIILGLDHTGAAAIDSDSDAPTAGVLGPISFTGLTPGTTYYAHWTHRDGNNNIATAVTSNQVDTDSVNNPVITLVSDDLYLEPPTFTFTSDSAGTGYWDFDASQTPPARGAGSIATGTFAVVVGLNSHEIDLGAYLGEIGYLHFRVRDTQPLDSNVLTSRQIVVDNELLAPSNTVLPQILGVAQEGLTATSLKGTWAGYPAPTYAYQWKRDGVAIGGATSESYLYTSDDVAQDITLTVTATNSEGSASETSAVVIPTSSSDAYLLENGSDFYLTEDTYFYLLEEGAYLLENGDFYLNEDGLNYIPLE